MGFDMKRNPLEENPLFSVTEEAVQDTKPTDSNSESAEKTVRRRKNKAAENISPAVPEQHAGDAAYTRATFIVREDLLHTLKSYAYTERREIKEVVNEIFEKALARIEKEYAARGESLIEPPKR